MSNVPWDEPGWRSSVLDWTREKLAAQGVSVAEEVEEVHLRVWSAVLRVPTDAGLVYFKATAPHLTAEVPLTEALSRWHPHASVPRVLAADRERGWMLLPDFGQRLRESVRADGHPRRWRDILPLYAALQRATAPHVREMLGYGVPDRRLAALPADYAALLDDTASLYIGQGEGLTVEEYDALRRLAPHVAALCERLAAYGIPETVQHEDLHDGNVFVAGGGRYTLADWGDACVSHPFLTLLVTLRSTAATLGLSPDATNAPELISLRDVYLDSWLDFAPRGDLEEALNIALRLGRLARALNWHRALSCLAPEDRGEHGFAVAAWLQMFLAGEAG